MSALYDDMSESPAAQHPSAPLPSPGMPPSRYSTSLVLLMLVFALVGLQGCSSGSSPVRSTTGSSSAFEGAQLPGNVTAPGFTLVDQDHKPVSLAQFHGQVVVLAFLYTGCAANCTVLAQQVRGALDEMAKPVPVLFISADPAYDTTARIARFLKSVSLTGRVHYLSGSLSQLEPLWRAYHITPASTSRSTFDKLVSLMLIGGEGDERVLYSLEDLTPETLSHDVRTLQAR
jgi:protein SCO1/2